jgi:hypothetical protein
VAQPEHLLVVGSGDAWTRTEVDELAISML